MSQLTTTDLASDSAFGQQCCVRLHAAENWWFLGVADTNDVIQKIEKTLNNTHTTTQKLTNNSFRNTKKNPESLTGFNNTQ